MAHKGDAREMFAQRRAEDLCSEGDAAIWVAGKRAGRCSVRRLSFTIAFTEQMEW